MINYTKKNVRIITLVLTLIMYLFISVICFNIFNKTEAKNIQTTEEIEETIEVKNTSENIEQYINEEIIEDTNEDIQEQDESNFWKLQIPKINLFANIAEGTTSNIIAEKVGHFTNTGVLTGNIGLAAHNRGYGDKSYFRNIKNLETGDEIIYQKDDTIKKYKVVKNVIIDETDWSYLQSTEDNRITLITCVEDQPEYRQCIQAVES